MFSESAGAAGAVRRRTVAGVILGSKRPPNVVSGEAVAIERPAKGLRRRKRRTARKRWRVDTTRGLALNRCSLRARMHRQDTRFRSHRRAESQGAVVWLIEDGHRISIYRDRILAGLAISVTTGIRVSIAAVLEHRRQFPSRDADEASLGHFRAGSGSFSRSSSTRQGRK